jgi:hypothetical protein
MATEVISGTKNITAAIAKFQSGIKKSWCACVDSSIPAFSMSGPIRPGYVSATKRGVKIRYITEITKENVGYCKELMEYAELRHLDNVKGSFAVSESEFVAGIRGKKSLAKLVYSNSIDAVQIQRDVFETLWAAASPASARMAELER